MLKFLDRSARMPEKRKLFKNTSFRTSREMFSMVPGLVRPSVALRSWKVSESVVMADTMGFSVTNEGVLSMMIDIVVGVSGKNCGVERNKQIPVLGPIDSKGFDRWRKWRGGGQR